MDKSAVSGMDKSTARMVHRGMLRRIYDWCIDAADKPHALWILGAVAFAESSFFPIPPDIMLLPMSLARPARAWLFAALCTIASVAGGVLGYAIGALLYDSVGQWLINLYHLGDKVEAFRASYAEWGSVIILLKGLTPIPYKLVTITSGFAGYNIWLFILCSIIARGGRFFFVADAAQPLWRCDPCRSRKAPGPVGHGARARARRRLHHRIQDDLKRCRAARVTPCNMPDRSGLFWACGEGSSPQPSYGWAPLRPAGRRALPRRRFPAGSGAAPQPSQLHRISLRRCKRGLRKERLLPRTRAINEMGKVLDGKCCSIRLTLKRRSETLDDLEYPAPRMPAEGCPAESLSSLCKTRSSVCR